MLREGRGHAPGDTVIWAGEFWRQTHVFFFHTLCPKKNNKNNREHLGVMGVLQMEP